MRVAQHKLYLIPLWLVTVAYLSAGCSLIIPTSRSHPVSYLLTISENEQVESPEKPLTREKLPTGVRILIEPAVSLSMIDSKQILFKSPRSTVGAYQFAEWVEPPPDVFHRALLGELSRANWVDDVAEIPGIIAANRLIRIRIDAFWLEMDEEVAARARVKISLTIVDLDAHRTIAREAFQEEVIVAEPSAPAAVMALSAASREILHRSVPWIYDKLSANEPR